MGKHGGAPISPKRPAMRQRQTLTNPSRHFDDRVTLRTVADHLGISTTTVSRALKRGSDVKLKTVEKVEAAARALGYRPHLGGINLRTGRTQAIGIILPLGQPGEVNRLVASLIEGVSAALKTAGYRTAVVPLLYTDDPVEALRDLVEEKSVDGVILTNTQPQDERVKYLLQVGIPFVTFGRTELFSPHAFVDVDHELIGATAAAMLLDAGHKAPVLIAPPADMTYSMQFQRGWLQRHADRGHDPGNAAILFATNTPNGGQEIAKTMLEKMPETTAAFIANEDSALGFISGLLKMKRHVGQNFGAMTYGGTQMHSFFNPALSAFNYPHFEIGQKLANSLVRVIGGGDLKDCREICVAQFYDFGSQHTIG